MIIGGEPFEMQIGLNPVFNHFGDMSVWNVLLNSEEKEYLDDWLTSRKYSFQIHNTDTTVEEMELQKKERTPSVFHCEQCPTCFWFDMSSVNKCRAMDMPHIVIKRVIEDQYSIQAINYHSCPVLNKESE